MRYKGVFNSVLLGAMILAFCASSFSEGKIVDSKWAASPAKIDAASEEWDSNTLSSQKKVNVDCAFMNDAENLYVLFVFKDPKFLSSIKMTGMTIWFNSKLRKDKDFGLRFIDKKITADQYISMLEEKMGAVPEAKKAQIRSIPNYMFYDYELINKISKSPSKFSEAQDPNIPMFRYSMQQKTVVYEFSIPLKRLAELSAEIGANPGENIQVCFEWGGTTKEVKGALAGQISSESTRATADSATRNLTEERERTSGEILGDLEYDRSELAAMRKRIPKKYSFWVELKLAQNQ